jgi:hypothetical protein
MANFGDFVAGVGSGYLKQDEQRREEQLAARKLKMANDMAMQLEERKRALEQKYPKYQFFTKMGNGDIVGVDTQGRPARVLEADPDTKKQMSEAAAAKSAEDRARAAYYEAQSGLLGAKTADPQRFMQPTRPKGEGPYKRAPNEYTAEGQDTAYYRFLQSRGKPDPYGKIIPAPDTPEMWQEFTKQRNERGLQAPSAGKPLGLLAAPQATGGSGDADALIDLLFQSQGG